MKSIRLWRRPGYPPWPPSLVDLFASPASLCPNRVQPALSSPKSQATTGLRHCPIGRYASIWTGIAVQMHYVLHITRARVIRVYYLHKICALRNNSSLLRMLRDVGDSPALGLAGCRLFATGETGTTPGRLHRQQLSGLRLVTAPPILSLSGCRIRPSPATGRTLTIHPTP